MFTSRAEFRLFLREDNADLRLSSYGNSLGLLNDEVYEAVKIKERESSEGYSYLKENFLTNSKENIKILEDLGEDKIAEKTALVNIVARSTFSVEKLLTFVPHFKEYREDSIEQILTLAKYNHYISKQNNQIEKMKKQLTMTIPEGFSYEKIPGLSNEIKEKLSKSKPENLFYASQISGITPASLDILAIQIQLIVRNKASLKEKTNFFIL